MKRTVLHVELPGVHVAAVRELDLVRAGEPVVVISGGRVLDVEGLDGVHRGQAVLRARRVAPGVEFIPAGVLAGAETYRAAWDELLTMGPSVEPTAWHAGYVEVTGCLPRRGVKAHLAALGRRLEAVTSQPPAQGLSVNKLIARHASPAGQVVGAREALGFLHRQRLRPSVLIDKRVIALLDELGCRRWGQVSEVPEPRLRALFGLRGSVLARWAAGDDPRSVKPRYPPPIETAGVILGPEEREAWLNHCQQLAATLAARLVRRGELTTEIILTLALRPCQASAWRRDVWRTFRRRLARGVNGAERLTQIVLGLLPADLDPLNIDEIRITLRGLRSAGAVQGTLFRDAREERDHLLDSAFARVRARYGLLGLAYAPEVSDTGPRLAETVLEMDGVAALA